MIRTTDAVGVVNQNRMRARKTIAQYNTIAQIRTAAISITPVLHVYTTTLPTWRFDNDVLCRKNRTARVDFVPQTAVAEGRGDGSNNIDVKKLKINKQKKPICGGHTMCVLLSSWLTDFRFFRAHRRISRTMRTSTITGVTVRRNIVFANVFETRSDMSHHRNPSVNMASHAPVARLHNTPVGGVCWPLSGM